MDKMDSNNSCIEDWLKENIHNVVLVVLPPDHQYATKNVLHCTHVCELNVAISNTLFIYSVVLP